MTAARGRKLSAIAAASVLLLAVAGVVYSAFTSVIRNVDNTFASAAEFAPTNDTAPVVSGTTDVGQQLSTSSGTWNNQPTSYRYQWQRSNSSGGYDDIAGATASTYTLASADAGQTVRSRVTATNGGGSASAASAATAVVKWGAPVNVSPPTVKGTTSVGSTLIGGSGTWVGGVTSTARQWLRCDSTGASCGPIAGATTASYTLVGADVGTTIRYRVTVTNTYGSTAATSDASAGVTEAPPQSSSAPSIGGRAFETIRLTAFSGTWSGSPSYAYQWQRSNGSGGYDDITSATSATYTVAAADVGGTLRVRVVATNSGGATTAFSQPTAAVLSAGATGPVKSEPDWTFAIGGATNSLSWALPTSRGTYYVGGQWNDIARPTGGGVLLGKSDLSTTQKMPSYAPTRANGTVTASVADGKGGVYIAGMFTAVGGVRRSGLAHIDSTGRVGALDLPIAASPNVAPVEELHRSGSTLYVGGRFSSIGGQSRTNFAAIDLTTNAVTALAPNPNNTVFAIATLDSRVLLGGFFSQVGGVSRSGLAAIDATTGAVSTTTFTSAPNSHVRAILVDGSTVYLGGNFTSIRGVLRSHVAAVDTTGALINGFTGAVGNSSSTSFEYVQTLALAGGSLFAGGNFIAGGGHKKNLARMSPTTGAAASWAYEPSAEVFDLEADGAIMYVAGLYGSLNGGAIARGQLLALRTDVAGGSLLGWEPNPSTTAQTVTLSGGQVFAGGQFSGVGATTARRAIAEVDAETGAVVTPDLYVASPAGAVASDAVLSASHLFVGGSFTTIQGRSRPYLARIDTATSTVDASWAPTVDNNVSAVAVNGTTLYLGGRFTTVNGAARPYLAAVDTATGATISSFAPPAPSGEITGMALRNGTLYLRGTFTSVGGTVRRYAAAVDATTGALLSWDPNLSAAPSTMTLSQDGTRVFFGGSFTTVGGVSQPRLAAVSATSTGALVSTFTPTLAGGFGLQRVSSSAEGLLVGGSHQTINGQTQSWLARISEDGGAFDSAFTWPIAATPDPVPVAGALLVGGGGTATNIGIELHTPEGPAQNSGAAPSISGQTASGSTLTGDAGGWSAPVASFKREWLRCDASGQACAPIEGATSATYTPTGADVGARLRLRVTTPALVIAVSDPTTAISS